MIVIALVPAAAQTRGLDQTFFVDEMSVTHAIFEKRRRSSAYFRERACTLLIKFQNVDHKNLWKSLCSFLGVSRRKQQQIMGITGLLPFIEKASRRTNISEFSGCTVAIDSYCWLHKVTLDIA
ncbi:Exonuclease [Operophtera brumata]|uniref:Exonuclease n=1 Tax=Operophtera brumata TaxID=104452 RepID=A0A0L7KPX9_OPEBR|nr:Exonuclease [Operophtera brumata]